jgi:hypothetical protein
MKYDNVRDSYLNVCDKNTVKSVVSGRKYDNVRDSYLNVCDKNTVKSVVSGRNGDQKSVAV